MILPIISGVVIIMVIRLVLWLFFPAIKGLLNMLLAILLGLLVMRLLASWFGLFENFVVGDRVWRVIAVLAVLAVVYFLFTLRGTARRMFLFVLALVGGFYLATLVARLFGIDGVGGDHTWKDDIDDVVVVDTWSVSDGDFVSITPGRWCILPWWWGIPDGSYLYAYELRSDGVCDAQMRVCDDGKLYGTYTRPSCPESRNQYVKYRNDYIYTNAPDPVDPFVQQDYIDLVPGIDGSQRYDFNGQRINPTHKVEVTGIVVHEPAPVWQVTVQPLYHCQTPWGEQVANGQFVKAYRHREWHGANQCEVQLRLCRNGQLLGQFLYSSCEYRVGTQW